MHWTMPLLVHGWRLNVPVEQDTQIFSIFALNVRI